VAALALGGARIAREAAEQRAPRVIADEPYAPTPQAAPLVTLGYHELFADLLFLRLKGYFGGTENTANGIAGLVEAIAALDPQYQRIYEWGARAITLAGRGVDNRAFLRAIAVLDAGARLDVRDDLLKSTPLGWACRWGREDLVRLLLRRGADPVEKDAEPWATPLAWATRRGYGEIVELLKQHGAT
jgi:hypothetical protein